MRRVVMAWRPPPSMVRILSGRGGSALIDMACNLHRTGRRCGIQLLCYMRCVVLRQESITDAPGCSRMYQDVATRVGGTAEPTTEPIAADSPRGVLAQPRLRRGVQLTALMAPGQSERQIRPDATRRRHGRGRASTSESHRPSLAVRTIHRNIRSTRRAAVLSFIPRAIRRGVDATAR